LRTLGEFRGRQVLHAGQFNAVEHLPRLFRLADLQQACPGVSYPTIKRVPADLKRKKRLRFLGRGRDAQWQRIGSGSH